MTLEENVCRGFELPSTQLANITICPPTLLEPVGRPLTALEDLSSEKRVFWRSTILPHGLHQIGVGQKSKYHVNSSLQVPDLNVEESKALPHCPYMFLVQNPFILKRVHSVFLESQIILIDFT
jgi:hypothetical protein